MNENAKMRERKLEESEVRLEMCVCRRFAMKKVSKEGEKKQKIKEQSVKEKSKKERDESKLRMRQRDRNRRNNSEK